MTEKQTTWIQRIQNRFGSFQPEERPPPKRISTYQPHGEHRLILVSGASGSGRTRALVKWLAQAQAAGQTVAFLDCDHSYFVGLGCNPEEQLQLVIRPQTRENAMDIALELVTSNVVDVLGIDSLQRLPSEQEAAQPMNASARPGETASIDAFWGQIGRELQGRSCCVLVIPGRSSPVLEHLCDGKLRPKRLAGPGW